MDQAARTGPLQTSIGLLYPGATYRPCSEATGQVPVARPGNVPDVWKKRSAPKARSVTPAGDRFGRARRGRRGPGPSRYTDRHRPLPREWQGMSPSRPGPSQSNHSSGSTARDSEAAFAA